jgi:TPR repeat protein
MLTVALGVVRAQQPAPKPQQSSLELYEATAKAKGDKVALQQLITRAEQGHADAQGLLGWWYLIGLGTPARDCVEALRWSRKGAEQGNSQAQFSLGMILIDGDTCVPRDQAEALRWFRKSAEQGAPSAQIMLGNMYAEGEGVPRDYLESARWRRKAADLGDALAQYDLGTMYEKGQGVPKDSTQAVQWYRKAADHKGVEGGVALARYSLGVMYEKGQGVQIDLAQAAQWYRKAAEQGNADAKNALDAMSARRFVSMLQEGGVYKVPVLINSAIVLNFVVDSGSADVSIPADVVTTLMRTGTITQADFIGARTYTLADGSKTSSRTFRIRSLKVGEVVLENVVGSVANREGDLLLGQSFLGRFKSWSIDNAKHALVLE